MSVHYNAFISYRHSPVDSRIAALVQRSLEHFRVPRAIQKKTGLRKIDRLFRDKEELPITSDLNDDIAQALANSDYLIVICSPRTGESVWVQREIETFLKNHSRRQVLTVLAEGEPSETIPEILRYDDSTDPVTGQMRRVPIEPLSCDWRMSDRQAKREELPRLAAAILGCGYDELRQRQRQYKMRRVTAGFSAALAACLLLTAYFVRTSITIQQNYEEALRSQSRYLASESLDILEEGDRMTAIQLALAALPDGARDRPVVPKAEYALSEAVGAYVSDASDPVAVGAYITDGDPVEFKVVPEKERIFILDDQDLLTVWNVVTSERMVTLRTEGEMGGFRVMSGGDQVVIWSGEWSENEAITCYDAATGEVCWQQPLYARELAVTPDETTLIAVSRDADYNVVICNIDAATGAVITQNPVGGIHEGSSLTFTPQSEDHFSPDGTLVGFQTAESYTDEEQNYVSEHHIFVYDWQRGEGCYLPVSYYLLYNYCFTEDNDIIMSGKMEDDGSYGFSSSYSLYDFHYIQDSFADILRVDRESGEVEWQNQLDYHQVYYYTALELCPGGEEVLCAISNVCQRMDCATGEILSRGEATSAIIDVRMEEGKDFASLILRNGNMASFYYDNGACGCRPYFVDDLCSAELVRGTDGYNNIYVFQWYSGQVLRYSFGIKDENWQAFTATEESSFRNTYLTDDYLVTINLDDMLSIYDLDSHERLINIALEEEHGYYSYQVMGLTEDGSKFLLFYNQYGLPVIIRSIDLATGTVTDMEIPGGDAYYIKALPAICGDRLVLALESYDAETVLAVSDLAGSQWSYIPVADGTQCSTAKLFPCGAGVILCNESGTCRKVDLEREAVSQMELTLSVSDRYGDSFRLIWDGTGTRMAAVALGRIVLCDDSGVQTGEIALNDRAVYGMSFDAEGKTLFVLCSDYNLYRYDCDGAFLSRSDIAKYINASAYPDVTWTFLEDGDLAFVAGGVFSLISCDGWEVSAYAAEALGFDPVRDRLITYVSDSEGYTIGTFQRYTTQDLVELGKALVGESELSEETKSLYGIS